MLLRLWLIGAFVVAASTMLAQEKTFLAPTALRDGEDAELRKALYEEWDKLPRGLKISGVVVDGAGKPVAKAKLTVLAAIGVELEGRADEQGRFQFDSPVMAVIAQSEEGDLLAVARTPKPARDGTLSLKLTVQPTKEVAIKVCDKNGKPIAGAYCGALIGGIVFARSKSDAEGRFVVRAPEWSARENEFEEPETTHFYALAKGFGIHVVRGALVDGAFEFPEELVLPVAQPLTVKVVDRDDKPLAGIPTFLPQYSVLKPEASANGLPTVFKHVTLPLYQELRSFAKSDEKGVAKFEWFVIPKMDIPNRAVFAPEIRMQVGAIHPVWNSSFSEISMKGDEIDATCKVYSTSKIRGRVLLPSGEPAVGIVLASREDGPKQRKITTDAKGEFELTASTADSELRVVDPKWVSETIELARLVYKAAEHQLEVKLREGKRVTIRVTSGPQFVPLKDQVVMFYGPGGSMNLTTDKEGRAETLLDRGLYRVSAMSNEIYGQLREPRQSRDITVLVKDFPEMEIPIHFDTVQPRVIKVTVLKPDGKTAVEKAKVEILNPFQADASTTTQVQQLQAAPFGPNRGRVMEVEREVPVAVSVLSDSAGKAEVRSPIDAPAMLVVSSEEGLKALANVDILEDSATITLRKPVSAKGRLVDEATGDPIVAREVEMRVDFSKASPSHWRAPQGSMPNRDVAPSFTAMTDEDGNFEIKELIPDAEYTIHVRLTESKPAAARPASRASMVTIGDGHGDRVVRSNQEGVTELGEFKVNTKPANFSPNFGVPRR